MTDDDTSLTLSVTRDTTRDITADTTADTYTSDETTPRCEFNVIHLIALLLAYYHATFILRKKGLLIYDYETK